jgi:hypothetical protein
LLNAQKKGAYATGFGALALLVTFILLHFKTNSIVENGVEISTYFQEDQPYDRLGDPVCLAGIDEPIGRIRSVRPVASGSSRWKLNMLVDGRYLSGTPTNSVVVRRWQGFGTCKVVRGSQWDAQFAWRGRFLEIECPPIRPFYYQQTPSPCSPDLAPTIQEHTVLESAVDCCGGLAEFVPEAGWQRVIHRGIDFVTLDVGLIWVEIAAVPALGFGAAIVLTFFVRQKRSRSLGRVVE